MRANQTLARAIALMGFLAVLLAACAPSAAPTATSAPVGAAPAASSPAPATGSPAAAMPPTAATSASPGVKSSPAPATSTGDSIKVGILHSLSGTMAISETSVRDAEIMAIDEINARGGVLGKRITPIQEDGASDWPTFAEKARKLIQSDQVVTVFGGWTSASRKAMLPVFEQLNGLLWYPVQYEGLESSPNIFYTGAAPNQQIVPSVEYLLKDGKTKFFLLGSDYVFPRTANEIIKAQLAAQGGTVAGEEYTPLGHTDYTTVIAKLASAKPDVIYNTLNGDSNVAFFKQLKDAGFSSDSMLTLSVSVAEEEIRGIGPENMVGHLTAWNYFQTTNTAENKKFVADYKAKFGANRVTDDPIEAGYIAVQLWAKAVEKAGSTDIAKVKEAAKGIELAAPEGPVRINGENQHISKIVRIGKARADGQFDEVFSTGTPVEPDPYLKTYDWAASLKRS